MDPNRARKQSQAPAAALRALLMTYFSDAELQTLAHDLGVDYEALPGQAKSTKVIQLLS